MARDAVNISVEERRKKMPFCTSVIDDLRSAFGANEVVYINAKENGQSVEWGQKQVPAGPGFQAKA